MQQWEERGYGQGRKKKKSKDVKKAFEKKLGNLERGRQAVRAVGAAARARAGDAERRRRRAARARGRRARLVPARPARPRLGWVDRLAIVGAERHRQDDAARRAARTAAARRGHALGRPGRRARRARAAAQRPSPATEPLLDAFVDASGLAVEDARTLLAKFDLGADDVLRRGALALTGGADARRARAPVRARRQLPRSRRADEPSRRRGDRGARARARRLRQARCCS